MSDLSRGDVSRTTEGSGLGLLHCLEPHKAQGGTFEILIDGDLFKVARGFGLKPGSDGMSYLEFKKEGPVTFCDLRLPCIYDSIYSYAFFTCAFFTPLLLKQFLPGCVHNDDTQYH